MRRLVSLRLCLHCLHCLQQLLRLHGLRSWLFPDAVPLKADGLLHRRPRQGAVWEDAGWRRGMVAASRVVNDRWGCSTRYCLRFKGRSCRLRDVWCDGWDSVLRRRQSPTMKAVDEHLRSRGPKLRVYPRHWPKLWMAGCCGLLDGLYNVAWMAHRSGREIVCRNDLRHGHKKRPYVHPWGLSLAVEDFRSLIQVGAAIGLRV